MATDRNQGEVIRRLDIRAERLDRITDRPDQVVRGAVPRSLDRRQESFVAESLTG